MRPPYEEASRRIFALGEGQYTEPIETETGWYIAQCGQIIPATKTPFADIQDEIYRLAEHATISDLQSFIDSAVERVLADWPEVTAPE